MTPSTRRKIRTLGAALGILTVVGLIAWTVLGTRTFHLARIAVEGGHMTPAWEVRSALHPWLDHHVMGLDVEELARDVMALPWVSSVRVQTDLPNRVLVRVQEYEASLIIKQGTNLWYATEDGTVFTAVDPERVLDLPVLTVSTEMDSAGLRAATRDALGLVDRCENTPLAGRVSAVHHDERLGYALEVGTLEVHVGWDLEGFDPERIGIALAWLPAEARVPAAVYAVEGTEDLIVRLHGGPSARAEAAPLAELSKADGVGR